MALRRPVERQTGFPFEVTAVDDAAALKLPGVLKVIRLDDAVAVVATSTWAAGRVATR